RLVTRPVPTGSPAVAKTIGMADVACFTARTCGVPEVTMTSTLSRTNSVAISAARSVRPFAQRYSIARGGELLTRVQLTDQVGNVLGDAQSHVSSCLDVATFAGILARASAALAARISHVVPF